MKVVQILPDEQVKIIMEALNLLTIAIQSLPEDSDPISRKLFDLRNLRAMVEYNELSVSMSMANYEGFTKTNGIDFPQYLDK